jgi:cytoskeleton protein RodZ
MDVGLELRQARERQGVSLRELSDRTKIGVSALRAIENNEIERLPGGIFTRGFLKAYAREVGLDPNETSDRFNSQFDPLAELPETGSARLNLASDEPEPEAAGEMPRYSGAISAIAALVLVAACFFVLSRLQTVGAPGQADAAVAAAAPPPPRAEVGTSGSTPAPPLPTASGLRVDLQPAGECWMSVTADGVRVVYRLMQPGERQTVEARDSLVLRAGDAAACGFSINGTPVRPLGHAGDAISLTITPENYKGFIGQ